MKGSVLIIALLIVSLTFSLVIAADTPNVGVGGEEVEEIQGIVGNYSPLDEEGNIDLDKYNPIKSKAEQRVDNINLWLEENASWLSAIFGIVPSISWLFAINLYFILLFLVILVFNGNAILDIFEVLEAKVDLMLFETHWSNVFGFGAFAVLLITKVFVLLSKFILELSNVFWNYVLPWGTAIAVVFMILLGIGFVVLLKLAPQVLIAIGQAIEKRREKKEAEKEKTDREVLKMIVKGATGDF